mgnify:CR=1 FL=1
MKKIIWAILAISAVGYFTNTYTVNNAKREAENAEVEKIKHATKAAVSQMVRRTNAIADWEETLGKGERYRFEPILTVELERLWLQQGPILFVGSIRDVATHDQSLYRISIGRSLYSSFVYMLETELELSLLAQKERVDSFLEKYPDIFKDYGFNNGVAVVARINSISATSVIGEEGERKEVKIGDGELLDILYTGEVAF